MSLSLSSLLNPSPDSDTQRSPPSPSARRDSNPPLPRVQSPEQHRVSLSPNATHATQPKFSYPAGTAQEAAQALAALSASPVQAPAQWSGHYPPEQAHPDGQWPDDRRLGSSYGDPAIQLPPPPSAGSARKMSSPTLEQYQVASRSPEQKRASLISPEQANFTLPPLQGFAQPPLDQTRASAYSQDSQQHPGHLSHLPEQRQNHTPEHSKSHYPADQDESPYPPSIVKEEAASTPTPFSPTDPRRPPETEQQTLKTVASLKNEHGLRTHSPLRESSVPVPTTEEPSAEQQPTIPKKRPAAAKTKKGTATTMKKAPPAKRRKVESKRDATPSSRASKPAGKGASTSAKGTPANSSPAPSTRSYSAEANDDQYEDEDEDMDDEDGDVYCICRKPDSGTFMIGCDGTCDDWFHGKCVGIEERDKNLIDKYMCPNCTKAGIGRTTWKRMCRRSGCRQAARVGSSKSGTKGSKYCSDECGVLFFREKVAETRGREDSAKSRGSRRKSSLVSTEKLVIEDDLGARGGALAAGEVKALIDASENVEEFRKLGDGVLSPPATPDGKESANKNKDFTEAETQALQNIVNQKEEARRRHALLKERLKFVNMVKQAASRTATEKDLKIKDYCGYDSRLEWTEEEFQSWRNTTLGAQAMELETLATDKSNADTTEKNEAEGGTNHVEDEPSLEVEICDKKKCARHLEWAKLAVDDLRMEMSDNGDRMRALDCEEKETRERAALRVKAGILDGEGSVEVHELRLPAQENSSILGMQPSTERSPMKVDEQMQAGTMETGVEVEDETMEL